VAFSFQESFCGVGPNSCSGFAASKPEIGQASMEAIRNGALIQDRYELNELLGKGGMAQVWRATDRRLNREVAIKFAAPQLAEDAEFLVRFFSEAQSVARIAHPHVVRVLDFGEADGSQFIVMEYVQGGSLADMTGHPILPERATEIVAQSARGAGAAHKLGVVHRDIKPTNILLTKEGHAKLADFGIAVTAGRERLTATGATIGSPHYISPEQASGREAIPASDVYALGVVLYELLTGRIPFAGNNPTAIAIAHVEDRPEPPGTHISDLEPELESLVMQCLEKDPDRRFPSGDELASALESGTRQTLPSRVPTMTTLSPVRQKRTRMVTAAVAAGFALLLGLAFYVAARPDPPPSQEVVQAGTGDALPGREKESPSPDRTERAPVVKPTPSPSPTEERAPEARKAADKPSNEKVTGSEPEASPTPTPSPTTAGRPSPTPTTAAGVGQENAEP
jgi:serine/threonine protein kinase